MASTRRKIGALKINVAEKPRALSANDKTLNIENATRAGDASAAAAAANKYSAAAAAVAIRENHQPDIWRSVKLRAGGLKRRNRVSLVAAAGCAFLSAKLIGDIKLAEKRVA